MKQQLTMFAVHATGAMLPKVDPVQFGLLVAAVVSIGWGAWGWYYGGSVVKVKFELGRTSGRATFRAGPHDFVDPQFLDHRFEHKIEGPAVDIAILTVMNRGRTPATIHTPSLEFAASGAAPVEVGGVLVAGGETEYRMRLEAHDSRRFYLLLQPMVDEGRKDIARQLPQGTLTALRSRALVTTGTGEKRRSSRWTLTDDIWYRRRPVAASWQVKTPLSGRASTVVEQLLTEFLRSDLSVDEQAQMMVAAVQASEDETSEFSVHVQQMLGERLGIVQSVRILGRATYLRGQGRDPGMPG